MLPTDRERFLRKLDELNDQLDEEAKEEGRTREPVPFRMVQLSLPFPTQTGRRA